MKNYIKTSVETGSRTFFFNDSSPEEINSALSKALQVQSRHADALRTKRYDPMTKLSVWRRCGALTGLKAIGDSW